MYFKTSHNLQQVLHLSTFYCCQSLDKLFWKIKLTEHVEWVAALSFSN